MLQHRKLCERLVDEGWQRYYKPDKWRGQKKRYDTLSGLAKGNKILDVGCGQGVLGAILVNKMVVGIDLSYKVLMDGKKRRKEAWLVQGWAEHLPFPRRFFDCVVVAETLEHVLDVGAVMGEVRRVLKKGGRLIASVPGDEKNPRPRHGHLRVFDERRLKKLLSQYVSVKKMWRLGRWIVAWGN